jgi:hypothetical protein
VCEEGEEFKRYEELSITTSDSRVGKRQLRRSEIFIETATQKATSSVRSDIEGGSRLDVAPTELVTFFTAQSIKMSLPRSCQGPFDYEIR